MTHSIRADIDRAVAKMGARFGARRELSKLREHLWEGERVDALSGGNYNGRVGLIVLTDRRVLFLFEGLLHRRSEDIPLNRIASVQWDCGLVHGVLTIFASGARVEIKQVDKKAGKMLVDMVRGHITGMTQYDLAALHENDARVPALVPTDDPYDQLTKLGTLREAGVLSEDEFQTKKREILSRI